MMTAHTLPRITGLEWLLYTCHQHSHRARVITTASCISQEATIGGCRDWHRDGQSADERVGGVLLSPPPPGCKPQRTPSAIVEGAAALQELGTKLPRTEGKMPTRAISARPHGEHGPIALVFVRPAHLEQVK